MTGSSIKVSGPGPIYQTLSYGTGGRLGLVSWDGMALAVGSG